MKELTIESKVLIAESFEELNPQERALCEQAVEAVKKAYAPYSKFQVGSALLLEDGTIIEGSNQENAVYPVGLCAERVAIFTAGHQHPQLAIKAIAVATAAEQKEDELPAFPCGSCRQVIQEQERRHNTDVKILVISHHKKVYMIDSVKDILPFSFSKDFL